jgi:hypothetical protein
MRGWHHVSIAVVIKQQRRAEPVAFGQDEPARGGVARVRRHRSGVAGPPTTPVAVENACHVRHASAIAIGIRMHPCEAA